MAHAARAHVTWMSAMIMVAVTASCVTWLIVSRETKPRVGFPNVLNDSADGQSTEGLAWENVWDSKNFLLDKSKTWIKVEEQGVYLVYVQLTYSLKKDGKSNSVDLTLKVEFNYTESKEEFTGAFDTRELREKEQDAKLSTFILLHMEAGNSLSILATPKERIKYDDVRPFSSFISIIRYADLSA